MEKRKEYAAGEIITCPKCGGDDLDCEEAPDKAKCLACGLEFEIRRVAVWESKRLSLKDIVLKGKGVVCVGKFEQAHHRIAYKLPGRTIRVMRKKGD